MLCDFCGSTIALDMKYVAPDGKPLYLCHPCGATPKPKVVCLSGSTRFFAEFAATNLEYTLRGYIVLSVGCDTKQDGDLNLDSSTKRMLDRLHMYKIDLADELVVINKDGYIGSSTAREIAYAKHRNIPITYLWP